MLTETLPQIEREHKTWVRWNVVNQNHRLIVSHLNVLTGDAVYSAIEEKWPFEEQRNSGIIPINHILRFNTNDVHVEVGQRVRVETILRLIAERQDDGEFRRIHLRGLCEVFTQEGEHAASADYWVALTRPFAQAGERRLREVPERIADMTLHPYAETDPPLDNVDSYAIPEAAIRASETDVFHLNQTDVNHHVNTVIYLDLAEQRIARHAAEAGHDVTAMAFKSLDVFYRKPFTGGHFFQVETDLAHRKNTFAAAVRFRHLDAGRTPSDRVAVGLRLSGHCA